MSEIKHTPGPLFVRQPDKWPFDIEIVDAAGEVVFTDRRHACSTKQETVEDVMTAYGMRIKGDPQFADRCIEANERQVADAYLRAAAPELLEALQACCEHMEWSTPQGHGAYADAQAALAKATGA